jgi:hypothetical protein
MPVSPCGDPVILALRSRTALARVQASSARLVEPEGGPSSQPPRPNKKPPQGWLFVWWRRRESNPRPQALYRQYYMLSLVV